MTAGCKEHKHKIYISPKSRILAFENSYPFTVNEGDRVNKHSWSKYMPFLAKYWDAFKQKILKYQVIWNKNIRRQKIWLIHNEYLV